MTGDIKNRIPPPLRFTIADDTEVTGEVIDYFLLKNDSNDKRYELLEDYYHNRTGIQSRSQSDSDKPNNRISHAFAKYICKIATAYFMGLGIRYSAKPKAYKKALDEVMSGSLTQIQHFEEAKEASKRGISFELLYFDPDGQLKSSFYSADAMIPVFSQTPSRYLALVLRPYTLESLLQGTKTEKFVEAYDRQYIYIFKQSGNNRWVLQERFSHNFYDVPVIIRCNNQELKGDFEDVIPQIDGYDKAQSDTANDLEYFSDAYLSLPGVDGVNAVDEEGNELSTGETAKLLRKNKMLFPPVGCDAKFITKNADDTQAEHHKDRLRNDIFFLSQVPNLTDESFAGNLSGVAIKYKLFGLEELVIEKETYFTSSELKKVRLITDYLNKRNGTSYDWHTVELKFDRSAVSNTLEIAQIMNLLRDILSDQTLLGMFPEVKDVAKELERKLRETATLENTGDGEKVF